VQRILQSTILQSPNNLTIYQTSNLPMVTRPYLRVTVRSPLKVWTRRLELASPYVPRTERGPRSLSRIGPSLLMGKSIAHVLAGLRRAFRLSRAAVETGSTFSAIVFHNSGEGVSRSSEAAAARKMSTKPDQAQVQPTASRFPIFSAVSGYPHVDEQKPADDQSPALRRGSSESYVDQLIEAAGFHRIQHRNRRKKESR
jgi:hypothetical protein